MSHKHDARECCLHCLMPEEKRTMANMTKTLQLFQQVEYLCWFGYLNPLERRLYLCPSPLWKFTSFRHTPIPLGISMTLHGGGYGYFLELHIRKSVILMFLSSLRDKLTLLYQNLVTDVSVVSGDHVGAHLDGHQHGVSTQSL